MARLTLYRANGMCSLIPHSLLTDLGVPFEGIVMKMSPDGFVAADGSISHEQYLRIHPNGLVPALAVDGQVITEMPAILTYIASLAPEKNLMGDDNFQHAKAAEWMAWLSGTLHGTGFRMRFRPYRYSTEEESYDSIRQKGQELIEKSFQTIDDRLEGKTFPLGDHETVVDFNLLVYWYWGREIGVAMAEKYPNYSNHIKRMESKDTVSGVVKGEGLKLAFPQHATGGRI